jgi:hypothetical protein
MAGGKVENTTFGGPKSQDLYGGPIPLASDLMMLQEQGYAILW